MMPNTYYVLALAFLFLSPGYTFAQSGTGEYAQQIFTYLLSDKEALQEELVPLSSYLVFVDQQDYSGEQAEYFKEKAIENYPRVQSDYQREVKRIYSFYSQRQNAGYAFEYTTATFIASENQGNVGYMVLRYSFRIEDEIINDKIIFECLRLKDQWYILDGFFEEVPED